EIAGMAELLEPQPVLEIAAVSSSGWLEATATDNTEETSNGAFEPQSSEEGGTSDPTPSTATEESDSALD
ncbi:MAG: hypothetical protein VYC83_03425, partial [Chloroflexota bacterium]|nr:hypothetical protein [Chloroflexota bacterium]